MLVWFWCVMSVLAVLVRFGMLFFAQVGFVFLMLLFVFVIYNDIVKSLARG